MSLVPVQRSLADVKKTIVTFMPDPQGRNPIQIAGLLCDFCNQVPTNDHGAIVLYKVDSPDRKGPIFLGPKCSERETQAYANGSPVGNAMRPAVATE